MSMQSTLDALNKEWSELNDLRNLELQKAENYRLHRNEPEEREHLARAKWIKEEMDACEDMIFNLERTY